jgi:hypothetical protein
MSVGDHELEDDSDELFACLFCNREVCDCAEDPDPFNDFDPMRESNP